MSSSAGKRCFAENVRLFGNANTEPEKFNLYNGLAQLASAIQDLERSVEQMARAILAQNF